MEYQKEGKGESGTEALSFEIIAENFPKQNDIIESRFEKHYKPEEENKYKQKPNQKFSHIITKLLQI